MSENDFCNQCGLRYCSCVIVSKKELQEAIEEQKRREQELLELKIDETFREQLIEIQNAKNVVWDTFIILKETGEKQYTPCWQYLEFNNLFKLLFPDLSTLDETFQEKT